jgi:hypothetical protein
LSQPNTLQFDFGNLTQTILNPLLNTLPIEITFSDHADTVRYLNNSPKMILLRTKAVIGMKVQNAHPSKSIDTINRITESFRSSNKKVAEFWINSHGRTIFIRFFAVRGAAGKYLGTVEVVQDITKSQALKGERRLLDVSD